MSVTRITAPELTFQKGRNEHLRIFGFTQRVIYRYRDGVCRNFKFILPTPSDRVALSAFYCAYSLQTPVSFHRFPERCRTTTHQDSPGYRHDPGHENLFSPEALNCTVRARSRHSALTSWKASAPWKIAAKRQAGRSGPPPPWTYAYPILTGT